MINGAASVLLIEVQRTVAVEAATEVCVKGGQAHNRIPLGAPATLDYR